MCQLSFTQLNGFSALYVNARAPARDTECCSLYLSSLARSASGFLSICLLYSFDLFLPLPLSHPRHLPSPLFHRSLHLSLYPLSPVYFPISSSLFAHASFSLHVPLSVFFHFPPQSAVLLSLAASPLRSTCPPPFHNGCVPLVLPFSLISTFRLSFCPCSSLIYQLALSPPPLSLSLTLSPSALVSLGRDGCVRVYV